MSAATQGFPSQEYKKSNFLYGTFGLTAPGTGPRPCHVKKSHVSNVNTARSVTILSYSLCLCSHCTYKRSFSPDRKPLDLLRAPGKTAESRPE